MDSERIGSHARRASSLRSLGETAGCFGQARGDAAIEIDSSWWLGDVGVVQDEGEFVAKNFHARIRPTSCLPADVEK
jgi:hypothetical protein